MKKVKYGKLVEFVHMLIEQSCCGHQVLNFIDATCGNGFDTLFLCRAAGENGHVLAFDIQEQAIERTKMLLKSNLNFLNYEIIKDSHEFISEYLTSGSGIDAAIFNLGYLPFSDKAVSTKGDVTVKSIQNLLPYLNPDGRIFITTYIAHDTGDEIKIIYSYLSSLDKSKYNVLHVNLINKENMPPELFMIEKNA